MFNKNVAIIVYGRAEETCDVCEQRLPEHLVKRPDGWMLVCGGCLHSHEDALPARVYPSSLWFTMVAPAIRALRRHVDRLKKLGRSEA